ncbi:MAG: chitobiase/beta-hexosaminidase C-terminal domain-containing protein, partial [Draconibacterium sp.]|nr:chitobiase/beta-hexosaminidase C-terminal domain-containing protein [Draconibacterium sp.]
MHKIIIKIVFKILLYRIFLFVIFISSVNNNGFAVNSFSKEIAIPDSEDKLKLDFSYKRNFYDASFELIITSNNIDADIIYTLDCSKPSRDNGIVYQNGIYIDSTIVVKAIAISANRTSKIYTHSSIFPLVSARQGNKPVG